MSASTAFGSESIEEAQGWTRALAPAPSNILPFIVPAPEQPEPAVALVEVNAEPTLTPAQRAQIEAADTHGDRNGMMRAIREALQKRSGKVWSVTGGKGTAWGWLSIDAPPARRTWSNRPLAHNPGGHMPGAENWEEYDKGAPGYGSSPAERAELAELLGVDLVHSQGESVPPGAWKQYLCRAIYGHGGGFPDGRDWD